MSEEGWDIGLWSWKAKDSDFENLRNNNPSLSYAFDRNKIPSWDITYKPKKGDILLFNPHHVHAVTTSFGKPRLTISTFIGYTGDNDSLVLWSWLLEMHKKFDSKIPLQPLPCVPFHTPPPCIKIDLFRQLRMVACGVEVSPAWWGEYLNIEQAEKSRLAGGLDIGITCGLWTGLAEAERGEADHLLADHRVELR